MLDEEIVEFLATVEDIVDTEVFINPNLIMTGTLIKAGQTFIPIPFDGYLVFVDREPNTNWSHSAMIVLFRDGADWYHESESNVIPIEVHSPPYFGDEPEGYHKIWPKEGEENASNNM